MKSNFPCLILICLPFVLFAQTKKISPEITIGIRTGAVNEVYSYKPKLVPSDWPIINRNSFQHSVFANYNFGKKKRWVVEAQFGYNNFKFETVEHLDGQYYYYSFAKEKIYTLNGLLNYSFANIPSLKWKHYVGVQIGLSRVGYFSRSFLADSNRDVIGRRTDNDYNVWLNYVGFQYFGKVDLSKHISIQYLTAWAFSNNRFVPQTNFILQEPARKRITLNFGVGYRL